MGTHWLIRAASRRSFVLTSLGALVALPLRSAAGEGRIEALAFDAFTIFDPRHIAANVKDMVPGKGDALAQAWLAKLFGYSWLVTAAGHYRPFDELALAALQTSAEAANVTLSAGQMHDLVGAFSTLPVWPDSHQVLERLKGAGLRLAFLSNLGETTLAAITKSNGLDGLFEAALSTDRVRRYKPSPEAYAMAESALHLPKAAIGFVAFGGWDAVGANWYGFKTAWINRLGVPPEALAEPPKIVSRGLDGALRLAGLP